MTKKRTASRLGKIHVIRPVAIVVAMGSAFVAPGDTSARQNTLSGGMTVGSIYDSNVYKSDNLRTGEWKSQLAPQFTLSSKGLTDTLALTYAPEFAYNFRREDDEKTHVLSLLADKGLSSRWKVRVNGNYANYDTLRFEANQNLSKVQNFLRADAPTQADIVRILFPQLIWDPALHMGYVVSQFQKQYDAAGPSEQNQIRGLLFDGSGRQRYWTSSMALVSEYEFAEKSLFSLGYNFSSQESKSGRLTDRVQQAPSLKIAYQFNPQWRAEVGYDLKFDSYDASDDSIITNMPHLQVDFQLSPKNLIYWNYTYQDISFDGTRGNTLDQSTKLGWRHSLDQQTALTAALGTAYLSRDRAADEREYSLDLGVSRTFEKGAMAITGSVANAVDDQSGDWEKARRSWELGSTLTYQLMQDLSSSGRVSYGRWRSWASNIQNNYDRFQAGGGLSYGLSRWLTLSVNYDYSLFDTAEVLLDDYTEHLISIRLSAAKELWRW